jgi:hypothetical protein
MEISTNATLLSNDCFNVEVKKLSGVCQEERDRAAPETSGRISLASFLVASISCANEHNFSLAS